MVRSGHSSSCSPSSGFDQWQLRTFSPAREARGHALPYARSIVDQFEEQVRRYPTRVAIESDDVVVTYDDLNRMANQIAHGILKRTSPSDQVIALLFNPGSWLVAALLGVSKAGKTWVGMKPSDPISRLTAVLSNTTAALLLTESVAAPTARAIAHPGVSVLVVDELNGAQPTDNPDIAFPCEHPACLIYTSGTTGVPKGVMHNHESLLRTTAHWSMSLQTTPHDRFSMIASYSHIAGLNILLRALLNGACLLPYDLAQHGTGNLARWLRKNEITILILVPALFRVLVEDIQDGFDLPNVRIIGLTADTVYPSDVTLFRRHFSDECRLFHSLGCTEVSGYRLYVIDRETTLDKVFVPAGFATEDKEVRLLDEHGEEVEPGDVGEIVVRSRYSSLGYWNRPDLTKSVFKLHEDGSRTYRTGDLGKMLPGECLVHLGRKDRQVQIRGTRVELREIETALQAHPGVSIAVIHAQKNRENDVFLTAYVQTVRKGSTGGEIETEVTAGGLRAFLADSLPGYMIPSEFRAVDALPLTTNGKVDFSALSSVSSRDLHSDTTYAPPSTPIESTLVSIYCEVLQIDKIGVDDNMHDMGVTSLSLMRILSRIRDTFHDDLPFSLLYDHPTIAGAANLIQSRLPDSQTANILSGLSPSPFSESA